MVASSSVDVAVEWKRELERGQEERGGRAEFRIAKYTREGTLRRSIENADIVERLREWATWLETRSFAVLDGNLAREAADMIEQLREDICDRGWEFL